MQIEVARVDLEPQLAHHHFEFILELPVLFCVLMEEAIEDWMSENLIPGEPILLVDSKTLFEEIPGGRLEGWVDL